MSVKSCEVEKWNPQETERVTGVPEAQLRRVAEMLPGTPILVTENGLATTDDDERIAFTAEVRRGLQAAVRDGVDVRGYLHWSLLDNFEWFSGYAITFGLIGVDRTTFTRTPKPSLAWLGQVARRSGMRD